MLALSKETLPKSRLTYLGFRVAFLETLERIALADQVGCDPHESFGYLTEVPFLACVPAHVQIDLLSATWARHMSHDMVQANLVDEAVLYAACETAAHVIEEDPETVAAYLRGGPEDETFDLDGKTAEDLRRLHLSLACEGDFLLVSQFEDLPPQEADRLKTSYGISEDRLAPMFDVLGRWYLTPEFLGNLTGLLTGREVLKAVRNSGRSLIGECESP